jgi:NAD(P)-dependent dehydrogenase (short-subunit alcohol dehydrogenase family)
VCLKGVFFGCKYAIPHMIKQGGGVIINTASGAGIEGVPNLGAYQAAKGGVVIMSKGIALDFARHKIRCVSICPGVIETPIAENCNTVPAGAADVGAHRHHASARAQRKAGRGRCAGGVFGVG